MNSEIHSSDNINRVPVTFRCRVDKRQYYMPAIMLGLFLAFILMASSGIGWGIFGVLFAALPMVSVLVLSHIIWREVTYVIDGRQLIVSSRFNTKVIDIDAIKKIRRGRFWVERSRNYAASYIKLRIVYQKFQYIYVSPENEESFVRLLQSINPDITYSSENNC